jgi:hypothetical protein
VEILTRLGSDEGQAWIQQEAMRAASVLSCQVQKWAPLIGDDDA